MGQILFSNFVGMVRRDTNFHKNLHIEILKILNEIRINYELFKNIIIMGNKNS